MLFRMSNQSGLHVQCISRIITEQLISVTDPQAHLDKDTNPTPIPVQFFNNDEKLQFD